LGCQQRGADALELIATATEAMAKNHAEVSQERDKFRRWWNEAQDEVKKQAHIIAGLRGCVARMKREAKRNRPLLRAIKLSGGAK